MTATILQGDCRERMAAMDAESIDAIVCDPPYELNFMGRSWDRSGVAFDADTWRAAYRVLKPGGHLLAFGGTRTYHRIACAIEDAGFDIRDTLSWMYGSGFPKSLDVSKAIDKAAGATREVVGSYKRGLAMHPGNEGTDNWRDNYTGEVAITAPATPEAEQWAGWGTALKPAAEEIVWAQKPYTVRGVCAILAPTLKELLCQSRLLASAAARRSVSSQNESDEGSGSVLWNAVEQCNTPDDLFGLMGTLQSESVTNSNLNIAWSWLHILADLWRRESTFTIGTASSLITDLRTLNFLLSTITPASITPAEMQASGDGSNVWYADAIFRSVYAKSNVTPTISAVGPAIDRGDGSSLRPDAEFICLARKPFRGTVAANVLAHGTGAINIDACRIGTDIISQHGRKAKDGGGWGVHWHNDVQSGKSWSGRWPPNVALDEDAAAMLDAQSGISKGTAGIGVHSASIGYGGSEVPFITNNYGDSGGASRFMYVAKASNVERWSFLSCNCETVKIPSWVNEGLSHNDQTDSTLLPKGISAATSGDDYDSSTLSSGSPFMGQFLPDSNSITSTESKQTTESITFSSSVSPNTSGSIPGARSETVSGGSRVASAAKRNRSTPSIGISRRKDGRFMGVVVPATLRKSWNPSNCDECGCAIQVESHPTQKPQALMAWLCRMITPPGGVILDCFMGSGSTGVAAVKEGFHFVGIDMSEAYCEIAQRRIAYWQTHKEDADALPRQESLI